MSEKEAKWEDLTEEQKANLKKVEAFISRMDIQEKITSMKTVDEVIGLYEENGFSFTEKQKSQIRKFAEETAKEFEDKELTSDELKEIAAGWNLFHTISAFELLTNPLGWATALNIVSAAIGLGVGGMIEDELGL